MQMESAMTGKALVVRLLADRLDAASAPGFKGKMVDFINKGHNQIILDLSAVDFIDSSGLGAMVSTLKTLSNRGNLILCNLRESVKGLFTLTRMDRVFPIQSSLEDALKQVAA